MRDRVAGGESNLKRWCPVGACERDDPSGPLDEQLLGFELGGAPLELVREAFDEAARHVVRKMTSLGERDDAVSSSRYVRVGIMFGRSNVGDDMNVA